MNTTASLFRALRLTNSLWIPAGVFYYLNHVAFTGSLNVPFALSRIVDAGLSIGTKIVFLTWLWGLIVEISSGEDPLPRFANFKFNLKKSWWVTSTTLLLPAIIHFSLFMTTGNNWIPLNGIATILQVVLTYWAAGQVVKIKYKHLLSNEKTPRSPSVITIISGLLFLLLSIVLFYYLNIPGLSPFVKPLIEIIGIQLYFLMFAFFADSALQAHPKIAKHFISSKTLILINLPSGDIAFQVCTALLLRLYPTFFAVLRALTPQEYRIIEYNRVIWNYRYYQNNALVAISCFSSNCSDAYKIAKKFRSRGSKVIIGGSHVSFFPNEALEFCDSVVIGPAESVWEQIIRDYENNSLKPIYHGTCPPNKIMQVHNYLLHAPVEITADCLQASRGCKFDCYFCANPAITGPIRMQKTVEDMMALINSLRQKKKLLFFIDNNIYADPAYAKKFLTALAKQNILWTGHASIDIAKDDDMLQLLKRSGCVALLIGYEIIAGSIESKYGGKLALANDYLKLTRKLQKAGVRVKAHFMFGFPSDSWMALVHLWWFCFRLSPEFTVVSFMTPLPGARLFKDAIQNEIIFNANWRAYDIYHQVIEHPRLGRIWLFKKAFTVVTLFFFLTTSTFGRLILLVAILLEILYFHKPA